MRFDAYINGIIITKEFISVGKAHIHICYMFLKRNKEIVVRNPKSKIFFYYVYFIVLLVCVFTIYTYFALVKLASIREDHLLRLNFDAR